MKLSDCFAEAGVYYYPTTQLTMTVSEAGTFTVAFGGESWGDHRPDLKQEHAKTFEYRTLRPDNGDTRKVVGLPIQGWRKGNADPRGIDWKKKWAKEAELMCGEAFPPMVCWRDYAQWGRTGFDVGVEAYKGTGKICWVLVYRKGEVKIVGETLPGMTLARALRERFAYSGADPAVADPELLEAMLASVTRMLSRK